MTIGQIVVIENGYGKDWEMELFLTGRKRWVEVSDRLRARLGEKPPRTKPPLTLTINSEYLGLHYEHTPYDWFYQSDAYSPIVMLTRLDELLINRKKWKVTTLPIMAELGYRYGINWAYTS